MRWLLLCGVILIAILAVHNVSTCVTDEDKKTLAMILPDGLSTDTYENQISTIIAIQDAVLSVAPENVGIPYGESREPADLLRYGRGLCYDRSRAIEKAFKYLGFETRHVFVYSGSLLTSGIPSHAITEVMTDKGWLAVDSNFRWIGLDTEGNPHPITDDAEWAEEPKELLAEDFDVVYGLYSRHGNFYWPMTPFPDVNWLELLEN